MDNKIDNLEQRFSVPFSYKVLFTNEVFNLKNKVLINNLIPQESGDTKILVVVDGGLNTESPETVSKIEDYFSVSNLFELVSHPVIVPGGEFCKNDFDLVYDLLKVVNQFGMDRHSYIIGVGGGAVLDLVGFVTSIAHRGLRHVRIPTTVLSQNDSGIGVKNGVNLFGKKNFVGCFAPPDLVLNDVTFLRTLGKRDWLAGVAEAVKVALIKDLDFFVFLEENASKLLERNEEAMEYVIYKCADLHLQHISSGDPFEKGSSRPLDFGHWSAHKLEQISDFEIKHGEAVAIGIGIDAIYSSYCGLLEFQKKERILNLLRNLDLPIYSANIELRNENGSLQILDGLTEFQEHIGGELTIMMLKDLGEGQEVNKIDHSIISKVIVELKTIYNQVVVNENSEIV